LWSWVFHFGPLALPQPQPCHGLAHLLTAAIRVALGMASLALGFSSLTGWGLDPAGPTQPRTLPVATLAAAELQLGAAG
jgi:hypothetical protein